MLNAYRARYEAKQSPKDDGYDYPTWQIPLGDFKIIMQKAEREGRVIRPHPKGYPNTALVEGKMSEFHYWGVWLHGVA